MISVLTGLMAGTFHVLSGPDHLAAVAPLAIRGHRRAWITGLRWGLGHSTGVILVGLLSLLLRDLISIDLISGWSERLVGLLLIGIGFWGLRKTFSSQLHAHEHIHGDEQHLHLHLHAPGEKHNVLAHQHTHAAFGIGALHGLAGSSHFLGVLPALAFHDTLEAVSYLVSYGFGTILAMTSFSSIIGLVAARLEIGGVNAYRGMMLACSIAALATGGYWLVAQ
ncbi:MAG: sulfite exporter TauE/SafE family protein [Opitutaceae bacterium]|nr:sulfite exporter TauE/SafE family protein [Verrucomicrobiales bacterium]